jgi:hypothetical protein
VIDFQGRNIRIPFRYRVLQDAPPASYVEDFISVLEVLSGRGIFRTSP